MNETSSRSTEPEHHEPSTRQQQDGFDSSEETQRIERLDRMMLLVMHVIERQPNLPVERASALVADARRAALAMFPDKAQAFDLLYWQRVQRAMRKRYRMH